MVAFLYNWQTLISGVLAIVAAGVGAFLLSRQIAQSEEHERSRLRARFAAARAVLPLALDEVASYAVAQIGTLSALHDASTAWKVGEPAPAFRTHKVPENVVSVLKEAIEALEANKIPNALELLSDMISEMQLLTARTEDVESQLAAANVSGLPLQLEQYIVQAARLYALALGLLPFARRAINDGPEAVTWNDAQSRLITSNVAIPGVAQILERELKKSLITWAPNGAVK